MAKKRSQLGDWLPEIPEAVQEAADAYDKAHTAQSKATSKLNTAKENLIEEMKEHGVQRVRVREGKKFLVLGATDKITYEKPAEEPSA